MFHERITDSVLITSVYLFDTSVYGIEASRRGEAPAHDSSGSPEGIKAIFSSSKRATSGSSSCDVEKKL
jgi:hypothetical protein